MHTGHRKPRKKCTSNCVLCRLCNFYCVPYSDSSLLSLTRVGVYMCFLMLCIISCICRKKLLASVNQFIHVNLALTLLLSLLVFVIGVQTATGSKVCISISLVIHCYISMTLIVQVGCAIVAVLLHYFFLSAFCWMLCEGIFLFLLLVVVFSSMSKRIWPFLLIGYGTVQHSLSNAIAKPVSSVSFYTLQWYPFPLLSSQLE